MKNWFFDKKNIICIVLGLHLFLLTQIKFTAWPEMLLWPYLMLKGWLPYKDIAIAHNPLLLIDLSFFYKIFGVGLVQLKIYTWLLILSVDLVTFLIVKKLWNFKTAVISVIFLIPLSLYYEGNGLWFDLVLALLFPFIYFFTKTKNYFWIGVFWALALLVKQTGIFLLIPIIWELKGKDFLGKSIKIMEGVLFVITPFLVISALFKILPEYFFWAYKFAGGKLPFSEGQVYLPFPKQLVQGIFPVLLAFCFTYFDKRKISRDLLIWSLFSMVGVYPRWELFHFLPAITFIALLFSLSLNNLQSLAKVRKYIIWFGLTIFILLSLRKVTLEWNKEARFLENNVLLTSSFIRENVNYGDKIFVLNSWEHFYALTDTTPVTKPWIPQFSWYLDIPGIQDNMLSDLIMSPPELVVMHPYSTSGLDSFRPQKIADFIDRYYYQVQSFGDFEILKKR